MHDSDAVAQLGLDLNWSWSHSADEIWKRLDPELGELTAYWEPLDFELPILRDGSRAGGGGSILRWILPTRFADGMRRYRF